MSDERWRVGSQTLKAQVPVDNTGATRQMEFYVIEKAGYLSGGGVALVRFAAGRGVAERISSLPEVLDALQTAREALQQYAQGKTWSHIAKNALQEIETLSKSIGVDDED